MKNLISNFFISTCVQILACARLLQATENKCKSMRVGGEIDCMFAACIALCCEIAR